MPQGHGCREPSESMPGGAALVPHVLRTPESPSTSRAYAWRSTSAEFQVRAGAMPRGARSSIVIRCSPVQGRTGLWRWCAVSILGHPRQHSADKRSLLLACFGWSSPEHSQSSQHSPDVRVYCMPGFSSKTPRRWVVCDVPFLCFLVARSCDTTNPQNMIHDMMVAYHQHAYGLACHPPTRLWNSCE